MTIREIQQNDNPGVKQLIVSVMTEFKADPHTTVLGDPSINTMYENYNQKGAFYLVAEENNKIIGGAGIKQLDGSSEKICELQRMFLLPEVRGKGTGTLLIDECIRKAKEYSYKQIYLESLVQMTAAIALYEKKGFRKINNPIGSTGHKGCDIFMLLDL